MASANEWSRIANDSRRSQGLQERIVIRRDSVDHKVAYATSLLDVATRQNVSRERTMLGNAEVQIHRVPRVVRDQRCG